MVGMREAAVADSAAQGVLAVADAFVLALERRGCGGRRSSPRNRAARRCVPRGCRFVARAPYAARTGCRAAARLFASERAAVWLHDRSARELVLAASSQGGHGPQAERVPVADALSRAAAALRTNAPSSGSPAEAHAAWWRR